MARYPWETWGPGGEYITASNRAYAPPRTKKSAPSSTSSGNVRLRKGPGVRGVTNPNTKGIVPALDPRSSNRATQDAYDAELEAIMKEFGRAMSGGSGGGGYGQAIKEAQDALRDIRENRAAIKETYAEYGGFIDPLSQEAISAAVQMVADAQPELAAIAAAAGAELEASFSNTEAAVSEEARLIGAGAANIQEAAAREDAKEELYLAQEHQEVAQADRTVGLTSEAARTTAVADMKLDQGTMRRRAEMTDLQFEDMEDQAKAALEAARQAAAAAAAQARARRNALAADRDAALQELDARYANPAMRGRINASEFLQKNASHLDYNRQQLMWNTLTEVIERNIPVQDIRRFVNGESQVMSTKELYLLEGATRSFVSGMRYQQDRDNPSPYRPKSSPYTITPPSRSP